MSKEEAKELVDAFDKNKSGTINYDEFINSLRVSILISITLFRRTDSKFRLAYKEDYPLDAYNQTANSLQQIQDDDLVMSD